MSRSPKHAANKVTQVLRMFGRDGLPVDIRELVIEYSKATCPDEPIIDIRPVSLSSFEGMLARSPKGDRWIIGVNEDLSSVGRINFTIAHEFGHYLLHRKRQELFECMSRDMHTWDMLGKQIEFEADTFASYLLMPLDDFRKQIAGQKLSIELLRHCADRYQVSLTAAALKWRELAPGRVVVLAAKDGFLDWSCSNDRAFRTGHYFATKQSTIEVPSASILNNAQRSSGGSKATIKANAWFPKESTEEELEEHAFLIQGEGFEYTLGILILPGVDRYDPEPDEMLEPLTGHLEFKR